MSTEENTNKLQPGVYQVFNFVSGTALDLDGINLKSIIGFPPHDGPNQKWEFSPLGKGYSIRNLHGGTYLTVEDGIRDGVPVVASPYPASWALEADDFEQGIWRIAWPNTTFLFDLANHGSQKPSTPIQLWTRYPFESCRLWRFVRCRATPEIAMIAKVPAPSSEELKPSMSSTADTVIDVEGLKLGGNGELTITTTTTTTTTTVTKVARLNCP